MLLEQKLTLNLIKWLFKLNQREKIQINKGSELQDKMLVYVSESY